MNIDSTTLNKTNHYFENYLPSELTDSYRVISTPSAFAKSTLLYIQEIGKLKCIKSHTSSRSLLDSFLIVIVISGSGIFTYQNKVFSVNSNDLIFIDCHKPYSHQSSEHDPWELIWVHFNGVTMGNYYKYFYNTFNSIVIHSNTNARYIPNLNNIMILASQKQYDTEIMTSLLLNELITNILTFKDNQIKNKNNTLSKKIEMIKGYIDFNFMNKLSLDLIEKEFFISKYYISREFKKAYGITLINYIIIKRITYSKELLRFSDMQIDEIARKIGINDNSYFNKVFKKIEGITASEYRKIWIGYK